MIALTYEALRLKEALLENDSELLQEWLREVDAGKDTSPEAVLLKTQRLRLKDVIGRAEERFQRRLEKI